MLVCVAGGLSRGWEPYWHFLWWFLWADSIRITEDFHLVRSCSHAKEVSLEHLFTNQVGFTALRHSQAKAQLPSNTLQCPLLPPTHTHTHVNTNTHTDPPVLQAFIWSLPVSRLLCQNLFKTFHTAGFLCKYCVPCTRKKIKHGAQLQTNSAPLEEEKKREIQTLQTELAKSPNSRIEGELYCCSHKVKGGMQAAF